jgi:hypothetical protein
VKAFLAALAAKVTDSRAELGAQEIGNSLYGLQGLNSDCFEVQAIIHALTLKIPQSREELKSQHIGNALYGMKTMNSEPREVTYLNTFTVNIIVLVLLLYIAFRFAIAFSSLSYHFPVTFPSLNTTGPEPACGAHSENFELHRSVDIAEYWKRALRTSEHE